MADRCLGERRVALLSALARPACLLEGCCAERACESRRQREIPATVQTDHCTHDLIVVDRVGREENIRWQTARRARCMPAVVLSPFRQHPHLKSKIADSFSLGINGLAMVKVELVSLSALTEEILVRFLRSEKLVVFRDLVNSICLLKSY